LESFSLLLTEDSSSIAVEVSVIENMHLGDVECREKKRCRCPELVTLQSVCIPHLFVKLQGTLLLNFSVTGISEQMLDDNILSHKKLLLKEVHSAYLLSMLSHL